MTTFPAQIQFQAGAYLDLNHNDRGEYAPELALLAGKTDDHVTRALSLLNPSFNAPQPVLVGAYRYATYTLGDAEQNFVAYAWPATPRDGTRCFALTPTGVVYETPATGEAPGIFALWGDQPVTITDTQVDPRWKRYTVGGKQQARRDPDSLRRRSGNQMRQLVLGAVVYQNDSNQISPPDFATLFATSEGDLTAKLLKDPGAPEHLAPYLYVRSAGSATSQQPMVVENPAVWRGEGCIVAYCDGHIGWIAKPAAQRVWDLAKQLAGSARAKGAGLDATDWAPVVDDLVSKPLP